MTDSFLKQRFKPQSIIMGVACFQISMSVKKERTHVIRMPSAPIRLGPSRVHVFSALLGTVTHVQVITINHLFQRSSGLL